MEFRPLPYENPEPTGSQYAQLWANSINDIGDTFAQNKRLRMVQEEENRRAKQDEFARAIQMLQVRDQYGSVGARRILQPNAPPKPILGRTSMAPGASRGNPMPIRAQSEMPMESMDLERPDQFAQARELYGSQGVAPFLEARKFGQETEDRDLKRKQMMADIAYKEAQTRNAGSQKQTEEDKLAARNRAKLDRERPKAAASLANTLREYDNMIAEAEAIKSDPGLEMATGVSSFMGRLPGTLSLGAKTPRARLETLKAKTLLNVLSSLKELSATGASGFGQLSNIEGETLRNSISTLDPDLDTPDFKESIDRFVKEMRTRRGVLQQTFEDTYGGGAGNGGGGMITVSNGTETMQIPVDDEAEAAQDGFRRVP